jgi:tetratricopeptide (TPR) repeat protein
MLQTLLARALLVTRGFTEEVERAYVRALALSQQAGEIPQMFPVLRGLSTFYALRGEMPKSAEMGQRILALADSLGDPDMAVQGHVVVGAGVGLTTDTRGGLAHLEQAIADYDPDRARALPFGFGSNPGVVARVVSGLLLWMTGYPERAAGRAADAVALARRLRHPFSLCYALHHAGLLNLWLGFPEVAGERARELIDVAEEHGFPIWGAVGGCLRGAALAWLGSGDEGLALLERGMREYRGLRSPPVFWPLLLQLQAGACGAAGRPADGLPLVDEALRLNPPDQDPTASEALGLKSDLLLAVSAANAAQAEACLEEALQLARAAQLPMLELRAALRLARLWQAQGRAESARDLLSGVHGKFSEGFAMPDLVQARALLGASGA